MVILEGIGVVLQSCWAFLTAFASLIPSLIKAAGLKTEIIAAAFGVPAIVVTLTKVGISVIKHIKNK